MARAVAKSRQLVSLACTNYHAVREAVCENFPAYKHSSLDAFKRFNEAVTEWRELSQHYSWTYKQALLDHAHHTVGVKPSAAKPAAQRLPRFELSKVDPGGALLTPAKKLHVKAGSALSPVRGHRYFSSTESTSCLHEAKTSGRRFQIVCHIKPGGVASWRRLYHTDERGYQHFKARGPRAWLQRPDGGYLSDRRVVFVIVLAGGCAYIYSTHLEFVPYTHRRHFVLLSPEMEREMGDQQFQQLKQQWAEELLPPFHPASVKVQRVAKEIIAAVLSAVGEEKEWVSLRPGGPSQTLPDEFFAGPGDRWDTPAAHVHGHGDPAEIYGPEQDLDDQWVERSRQKGLAEGQRGYLDHLKGMKWEIIVVDLNVLNAMCLPGGKIVVFTGLLKQFKTDEEIATVLGHEVAHAVARHVAEKLTQGVWLGMLRLAALIFFNVPAIINDMSELLISLPFSRRMEMEADHLGLVIMAAAGFNPVLAPSFYDKLGQFEKNPEYLEYLSTHPLGKRRAESLRDSETMKRAMLIYKEKLYGRLDIRQFL